jgi:N-dimethylarginine dimethylaminohydrolase
MQRLMCPPTYFDVEYSINPWMDVNNPVDRDLALEQWWRLHDLLIDLGDKIDIVDAVPGLPDMTFAGDGGLVFGQTFIPSNFRHRERQGEVEHFRRWFSDHGFTIHAMPPGVIFEGLGDVVFHGVRALIGHGPRSDRRAVECLREMIPGLQTIGAMEIVDDRYFHVAMALAFIDDQTAVYYPPAFTPESVDRLREAVGNPIPISDEDANEYFACNNLVIGSTVIIDGCTSELHRALAGAGYDVITCPMSEFKKSGGSLRCLVLSFL